MLPADCELDPSRGDRVVAVRFELVEAAAGVVGNMSAGGGVAEYPRLPELVSPDKGEIKFFFPKMLRSSASAEADKTLLMGSGGVEDGPREVLGSSCEPEY